MAFNDNKYAGIGPWTGVGPIDGNSSITNSTVKFGPIGVYLDGETDLTISDNTSTCPGDEGVWISSVSGASFADADITLEGNVVDRDECPIESDDSLHQVGSVAAEGGDDIGSADLKIDTRPKSLNGMSDEELDDENLEAVAWYVLDAQELASSIELWDGNVYVKNELDEPVDEDEVEEDVTQPSTGGGGGAASSRQSGNEDNAPSATAVSEEEDDDVEPEGEVLGVGTTMAGNDELVAILTGIAAILQSIQEGLADDTITEVEAADLLTQLSALIATMGTIDA